MFSLHGTGVGAGITIGKARVISSPFDEVPKFNIADDQIENEIARLQQSIGKALDTLKALKPESDHELADEVIGLLEAQMLMIEDPLIFEDSAKIIREQKINAESALQQHGNRLEQAFAQIQDPYLSSKSTDVAQVVQRILSTMMNAGEVLINQPEGAFDDEIIIANDLTPADTIELRKHKIAGFITNLGGPISHTAILARSMKIPAIVGLHGAIRYLRTGDTLILDGKRGVIMVGPDSRAVASYERRREKIERRNQALESLRDAESMTLDGLAIKLMANIELPDDIALSSAQNAEGVGLYRTEFLFMNRAHLPDEEEQVAVYSEVVRKSDHPVTIRTLDLGADKQVDGGRTSDLPIINPALGMRAIRLCLHDLGLFKPQLRAILRSSVHGSVRMMIPMISNIGEINQVFRLLEEVKRELSEQGHEFDPHIPVGGMIEVPAAAIAADIFASRLDFLSIGTNDLIQYTLAIDRIDDEVNYLYDPLHPSILRLIKMVIAAGQRANIPVSMCGEMAGDAQYTQILLALGLREFSMDPASILEVKQMVRLSDVTQLELAVPSIMDAVEPEQLREQIKLLQP